MDNKNENNSDFLQFNDDAGGFSNGMQGTLLSKEGRGRSPEYEEIWQKIKGMSQRDRKQLAYEMTLKGFKVGYIHPHYYFDAKAVHDILFYPQNSQHEIEDKDNKLYTALKDIMDDDKVINLRIKRYAWLPRFINNWREGKTVKSYISSRYNGEWVNRWYRILPGDSLAGERPRSLFITLKDGNEVVYKMVACNDNKGYEEMTFMKNI